ncbi:MAG: MmcQ/YjbR family DNA-binding protein [Tannerellaceae bacterium]|jgi:predicted DNA-binding protein (MmcQ/YjbR family)|nr:MmcQ/YjbR family DNA-binding protein [Tannerellaceae bacterium]
MNIEEVRRFCLRLPNVSECFPFDEVSLVFKVENKMFLLLPLDADEPQLAVKCDPDMAIDLRQKYNAVEGAYHFNKKYWNTIYLNRDMPSAEIESWIIHSFRQVIGKLPRKVQQQYKDI